MMKMKRFELNIDEDKVNDVLWIGGASYDLKGCCDIMNKQQATIERLRTQLLICQQSKNDDGRFKVWEVPPTPKGTRITVSTTFNGDEDEI